ncbi:hypothetical protein RJ641_014738 [Dillenia turbinata]|uniref:Uncharacterized protein n=1 Tax=Dillenia turbinata TaxID=194707 RepID=A0AAN8Z2V1_9MAGN
MGLKFYICLLDSESKCGRSTLTNEPDYKSFKFSNDMEDTKGLKPDPKKFLIDGSLICCNLMKQNSEESDCSLDLASKSNKETFVSAANKKEQEENCAIPIDCAVPELVVFFQEREYQVVKDICINKEIPSHELNHDMASSQPIGVDKDSNIAKDGVIAVSSVSNGLPESPITGDDMEPQTRSDKENDESAVETVIHKMVISLNSNKSKPEQSFIIQQDSGKQQHDEVLHHVVIPTSSSLNEEFNKDNRATESTDDVDKESTSQDSGSSSPSFSGSEDVPKFEDSQHTCDSEIMSTVASESLASSCRITMFSGDCSFAAALSVPISFSGPIPYSGSTSLRSNSSTASVQSFAFPILESEWNGSPVRMVNPDETRLRKHPRWKSCCFSLCCKF